MQSKQRKTITAQCIIKNEENFIRYAILSVIDYVDTVLVFDTGSIDKTSQIVGDLAKEFPNKIIFEEKGICDKVRHTQLRQEMLERTKTDWFMLLDGDEVWSRQGIEEAIDTINAHDDVVWLGSQYYLCVGDVYHTYYKEKFDAFHNKFGFFTGRFIKNSPDIKWQGDYEVDLIVGKDGENVLSQNNLIYLQHKYWHLTHLRRSSADDEVYTSGIEKLRKGKRRLTYFIIGRKITEPVPEVFEWERKIEHLSFTRSLINFFSLFVIKPDLVIRRFIFWKNSFLNLLKTICQTKKQ